MRRTKILLLLPLALLAFQDRDADLTKERLNDAAADFWIYDDLKTAKARAVKSGRPILLSFR